ncbi:hypothetical protein [Solilutibacter tolerans]|uniref:Uncharacterized protein n=1 Tax=Solilutibacter tolerans TaxID=1604334 RepID=A0A1N6RE94_9GAMM|nr:hypothetical protein [Lysobacter tolerans]SIQ27153.1 hypothetical protein SAMN05421546_0978 [Lysobacter tolerans]
MYWLLLPAAALALILALRTPSPGLMLMWFCVVFAALAAWTWFRYRQLFPVRDTSADLTPLDPAELARLRFQAQANREAEASARLAAESEALHPIHPIAHPAPSHHVPDVTQMPIAPGPAAVERPLTGRAVFVVPDEPSSVIIPGERST